MQNRNFEIKSVIAGLVAAVSILAIIWAVINLEKEPTKKTRELCWAYATRDHEGEMSPERWKYLKTIGDPNDPEFFYQSCISSLTGKPAIKRYMR